MSWEDGEALIGADFCEASAVAARLDRKVSDLFPLPLHLGHRGGQASSSMGNMIGACGQREAAWLTFACHSVSHLPLLISNVLSAGSKTLESNVESTKDVVQMISSSSHLISQSISADLFGGDEVSVMLSLEPVLFKSEIE